MADVIFWVQYTPHGVRDTLILFLSLVELSEDLCQFAKILGEAILFFGPDALKSVAKEAGKVGPSPQENHLYPIRILKGVSTVAPTFQPGCWRSEGSA
jgi:hypothetical protein